MQLTVGDDSEQFSGIYRRSWFMWFIYSHVTSKVKIYPAP